VVVTYLRYYLVICLKELSNITKDMMIADRRSGIESWKSEI